MDRGFWRWVDRGSWIVARGGSGIVDRGTGRWVDRGSWILALGGSCANLHNKLHDKGAYERQPPFFFCVCFIVVFVVVMFATLVVGTL